MKQPSQYIPSSFTPQPYRRFQTGHRALSAPDCKSRLQHASSALKTQSSPISDLPICPQPTNTFMKACLKFSLLDHLSLPIDSERRAPNIDL